MRIQNKAYEQENKNLASELREQAGNNMAQQDAVVKTKQKNMTEQGGFRTYNGREDVRRGGDRPQFSGEARLVSAVEGNRARGNTGNTHSVTLAKPMPESNAPATINVRLAGSSSMEQNNATNSSKGAGYYLTKGCDYPYETQTLRNGETRLGFP